MRFQELFEVAKIQPLSIDGDTEVDGLSADSRSIEPQQVFLCVPSAHTDAHSFIEDSIEAGASAVIVHSIDAFDAWKGKIPVAFIDPDQVEDASWKMAKAAYDNPSSKLKVVGVTGTNGKTTVAWMIRDMLQELGANAAYIGTLGFRTDFDSFPLPNTTPNAIEVHRLLDKAVRSGCDVVAMEVSSHALALHRVDGVEFDVCVLTNLTQDHLDFHGNMDSYAQAKRRLFDDLPASSSKLCCAVINTDDAFGATLTENACHSTIAYGRKSGELRFQDVEVGLEQLTIRTTFRGAVKTKSAPLGARFNIDNCAAAIGTMLGLGYAYDAVANAISSVHPVPGRFEPIPNDTGVSVIVDYAHTPDALEKLLSAVKEIAPKRLVTVFGCGGDRDRSKRPLMARAVSEMSDLSVVTSDNPRSEVPEDIVDEVLEGILPYAEAVAIVDRREAIKYAIRHAEPGDVVVVAGKGHEDYQIIGRSKIHMDDREMARQALEDRS